MRTISIAAVLTAAILLWSCGSQSKMVVPGPEAGSPTTPTPPTPPSDPTPPQGTTLDALQESSNWQTCGSCGNQKGNPNLATYTMTRGLTTPTRDGAETTAQFTIGGSYPYTNAYWHLSHTAPSAPLAGLVYDFYLYVPAESVKAPQAIEFECQHTVNGYTYNFAWQADYASHKWRTFDYTNKVWIPTSVAFSGFTGDTWHHIVAEYHADGTNAVHDALTVDEVRSAVNVVRAATPNSQAHNGFSNAFQLDLNGMPVPYSVFVTGMKVTYW